MPVRSRAAKHSLARHDVSDSVAAAVSARSAASCAPWEKTAALCVRNAECSRRSVRANPRATPNAVPKAPPMPPSLRAITRSLGDCK